MYELIMERKVIKRLSNTSYWSDGEGLWLKPNIGGEFREKDVSVVGGRKWHKEVGFLDSYFKEPFSDIPQMVKVAAPKEVKEEIIKPIIKDIEVNNGFINKIVLDSSVKKSTRDRKLSADDRVKIVEEYVGGSGSRAIAKKYGISYSMVMRYVRIAGVEYRAASGRKKAL
jgi:hypothetical protein